ncbi:MAG: DUF1549 and DUF1553 domain-containing protein [Pirellulales bacterium]|nr:DUF1549 and DUF1553 domain-containing protein [Pirellulales bacterium]
MSLPLRFVLAFVAMVSSLVAASKVTAAPASDVARKVDQLLATELPGGDTPAADDETFLRRVSLDTIGRNPSPTEIAVFALDPTPDKRRRVVRRLLSSEHYGQNWARYWRDVIFSRRQEDRSLIAVEPLIVHMTKALNANKPWNEIATEFITATGDVRKEGTTAIIYAQDGRAEETAAEISRIFLGVQIQCAQCHDHKTDRWEREQFHQFAAFFPRMRIQRVQNPLVRSFEVASVDRGPMAAREAGRGSLEHYMRDLDNPKAQGTLMTPQFFVSAEKAELGMSDQDRRGQLAEWLTADDNPWFARALVNRIWAELVGEGFYEPIDDMGPDHDASAPKTLDYLSEQFVASGHDVKWLISTMMATEIYQRESRARRKANQQPFAANCLQPLRSDALFDALVTALEIELRQTGRGGGIAAYTQNGPRQQFNLAFGYDPSLPRDGVAGTIPQALFLMNSAQIDAAINARRPASMLGRLLSQIEDDDQLVAELYLRTLARQPNDREMKTCLEYIKGNTDRVDAFEDVLWSLINSTEFRHRK